MEYFKNLQQLLSIEKQADKQSFLSLTSSLSVTARRENGMTWFPVAIRDTEIGRGDYITVEVERTTHFDIIHQLRFGMTAALFSNHNAKQDRLEGTVTHISANRLRLSLRVDDLPDWTRSGKLGIDAVFDDNSYSEMENALKTAASQNLSKEQDRLLKVLTGLTAPTFNTIGEFVSTQLNTNQLAAVNMAVSANDAMVVHGPPGTGKTTTLVYIIQAIVQHEQRQILVVAPSNAAVDLLTEKINEAGLKVVRIGNPARVNEKQLSLTLDHKMLHHPHHKEIKRLKKRAAEFRDLAHKYKRSFGASEREQRKALFNEARNIRLEVEKSEQYIVDDVINKAQVITATLVGANHYTIRHLHFETLIIDEAAQALEPACWIPILKARRVIMAGDHFQLPPTIKSEEAARAGLGTTLLEKFVHMHPAAVLLLQEQYRMNNSIMQFSSNEFYEGRLYAHPGVAGQRIREGDLPVVFIDTAGCGYEEKQDGAGISNPEEAGAMLLHLTGFLISLSTASLPTVAVISPYRHQVTLLQERLLSSTALQPFASAISVNTIDSFQGQERDVVYISLTRSNADSTIGFLSETRRMNVAMTRARKKLVVIGDSATLSQFNFYADFIAYTQSIEGYMSAWELMTL